MTEKVLAPGDLSDHYVTIDGTDITNFVMFCHVYQDIFTPFWTAQLGIADANSQIMNLPIKPGSELKILIGTDAPKPCGGKKEFSFVVFKISQRHVEKQEVQSYVVHGITKQFFTNQKKRIQRTFKLKPPVEIVGELCGSLGGSLAESDSDPTLYDLLIPNWSPVIGIEWVSRFAKKPDGGADFLFYQSDLSSFKWKSLDSMFGDQCGLELIHMQPHIRSKHNEDPESFVNMESVDFIVEHDAGKNMQTGYYANTLLTHDIINKTRCETTFTFGEDIGQDKAMKPFSGQVFSDAKNSHISFQPDHPGLFPGENPENTHKLWAGSRKTNIPKLDENRLVVSLAGFACGWQWLGKACMVMLPSHQDQNKGEIYDKYLKGDYLIMAIKHVVSYGSYKVFLELGKKRLDTPYS